MMEGHIRAASEKVAQGLEFSARRTAARPLFAVMAALVTVSVALQIGLGSASAASPAWTAAVVTLGCGLIAAWVASRLLARGIADIAVRPAELLIEQIEPGDASGFFWNLGRPLSRREIAADLKLLQRRSREIARRARITIGDLERAREQASQQNIAKSQFLANMSHELRTPLNAILGYAMLLQEDASESGNEGARADLERIQQAGRNLLALINDILDLANIDTGRTTLERTVFDVRSLVDSVALSCGAADSPNGNSFRLQVADTVDLMVGDSAKLRQSLVNLLKNAFKFTRNGSVELEVSPLSKGGEAWVEFAIRDTGIGISPEDLDRLFDSFQQLNGSETRQYGGTGLGLAVVRRLATAMGGECVVESVRGEGSVFRLRLPMGDPGVAGDRLRLPKTEGSPANVVTTAAATQTALLIDDDEATVELIERWLVRMGHNVVSSTQAEAALELARSHRPDFILLDALLPHKSGYELLGELRADPELAPIPTIMITVEDDRRRGLRAGAADYLRKPLAEDQLRAVLDVYRQRASGEILVIDDDDDSADLLARCVGQVGFSSRRAADGEQGLAMAEAARPAAIVLDLAMPGMSGFDVLDKLAESESLRSVPLIVVSGCDISIDEHRRLVAAGHRFFPKALSTPREIAQSLKELVA